MGKPKNKAKKSHLTKEERKEGKSKLYFLLGLVTIGAIFGIYLINQTH